jgi:dienelactone hydrolase
MQDVMDDIGAALAFIEERADGLGIDRSRLAFFGISMGVPYAVCAAGGRDPKPRCVVAYYGPLDWSNAPLPPSVSAASVLAFSPLHRLEAGAEFPPLLIVRAGEDNIPLLNESIDAFVVAALSKNFEFDLINHSEGSHGFDVRDASRRSQAVIASTLEFLRVRLLEQ